MGVGGASCKYASQINTQTHTHTHTPQSLLAVLIKLPDYPSLPFAWQQFINDHCSFTPSSCLVCLSPLLLISFLRNLQLEKQVRREIRDSIEEQERRLQRQLEAAQRRQAGAEAAAAAAAAAATANPPPRESGGPAALGTAARERAEAVRRRRAMLEADEARAKVYAFKRKGELRTQALLRGVVRGAKGEEDIAAAAEAFEVAADGAGLAGATAGRGPAAVRGPVIASGAPRSTWESWNEQVGVGCFLCGHLLSYVRGLGSQNFGKEVCLFPQSMCNTHTYIQVQHYLLQTP